MKTVRRWCRVHSVYAELSLMIAHWANAYCGLMHEICKVTTTYHIL